MFIFEDGVVGAHGAMTLSQSRQLAAIVKALPYTSGPTQVIIKRANPFLAFKVVLVALDLSCFFDFQVLLPGTSVKAVAAAKELICTGSCLLGEVVLHI